MRNIYGWPELCIGCFNYHWPVYAGTFCSRLGGSLICTSVLFIVLKKSTAHPSKSITITASVIPPAMAALSSLGRLLNLCTAFRNTMEKASSLRPVACSNYILHYPSMFASSCRLRAMSSTLTLHFLFRQHRAVSR